MKQILSYLQTNTLKTAFEDHKVLLTEPPNNPKKNKMEIVDLMFQEFKGILATEYYGHQKVSLDGKELAIKKRIFSDLLVKDVGDGAVMFMQFEFLMEQVEWLPLV